MSDHLVLAAAMQQECQPSVTGLLARVMDRFAARRHARAKRVNLAYVRGLDPRMLADAGIDLETPPTLGLGLAGQHPVALLMSALLAKPAGVRTW